MSDVKKVLESKVQEMEEQVKQIEVIYHQKTGALTELKNTISELDENKEKKEK